VEAVLLRPDGAPAETGEIGELFSRSLYGFNGYLNRPEETADTMRDGWISVGDLAVRDSEGFFHIVGRQKDVIITGGVNVYPREIELVLERASGVGEAAVVGVADPEWGERVEAFIVAAEPGSPPSAAALAQVCRAALSAHKAPRAFHFIDAMPRNASGKLLRKDLRARAVPDN
jgi:long-chain acyl-CoA synthetase